MPGLRTFLGGTMPDATSATVFPAVRRPDGRGTGKPGTFTARAATSSSDPFTRRQSPDSGALRIDRTCSSLRPDRMAPATQIPNASSPARTSAATAPVSS